MAPLRLVIMLSIINIMLMANFARAYLVTEYLAVTTEHLSFPIRTVMTTITILPTVTPVPTPIAEMTTYETDPQSFSSPVTIVDALLPPGAGDSPSPRGTGFYLNCFVEFTYTACTAFPTTAILVTQLLYNEPLAKILKPTSVAPLMSLPSSVDPYDYQNQPVTASLAETDLPPEISRLWKYSNEPTACYDMIYTPAPTAPASVASAAGCAYPERPGSTGALKGYRCSLDNPCCFNCLIYDEHERRGAAGAGALLSDDKLTTWFTCPDGNAYFFTGNASNSDLNGRPPAFLQSEGPVTPTPDPSSGYGCAGSYASGGAGTNPPLIGAAGPRGCSSTATAPAFATAGNGGGGSGGSVGSSGTATAPAGSGGGNSSGAAESLGTPSVALIAACMGFCGFLISAM